MEERPSVWSVAANILISSQGQPTRGGSTAWRLGEVLSAAHHKSGYILETLPRIVTPYRDSVDEICDHVTYQKLVTR
jgi:hypothetical protein